MHQESESFYRQVSHEYVANFPRETGEGELSKCHAYLPFTDAYLQSLSLITDNKTEQKPDRFPKLVQTSKFHKRVYELRLNEQGMVYWNDEYKNIFATLSLKGNNTEDPYPWKDPAAPYEFIINGLQDSDSLDRQAQASKLLREMNIDTEIITAYMEPALLPHKGELITLSELKKAIIQRVWDEDLPKENKNVTREDITDLAKALHGMTFYITLRGMQTPERLLDLSAISSKEQFQELIKRPFQYFNKKQEVLSRHENVKAKRHKKKQYNAVQFNPTDDLSVFTYFTNVLPYVIGYHYGKMHEKGLLHVYPHLGNIGISGSIYDLDSVRGEPLDMGDKVVSEEEKIDEMVYILFGGEHNLAMGMVPLVSEMINQGYVKNIPGEEDIVAIWQPMINEFLKGYYRNRAGDKRSKELHYHLFFEKLTAKLEADTAV